MNTKNPLKSFLLDLLLIAITFGGLYITHLHTEISDIQYRELYILCQENEIAKNLTKDCMSGGYISNIEYEKIMKLKRLSNKKVLLHMIK